MKNKMLKYGAMAVGALALVATAKATGVADTDISQSVDNVVSTWTLVKTGLIGIGVFLVAWGFFKKLRRA